MKAALSIVGGAIKDAWGDLWTMLVCNLLWLLANLLVIPGPPATLALVQYTNRLAHGEVADFSDFWKAFRGYWGPAWRWGAINLGVVAFLLGDFLLTSLSGQGVWQQYLQGLYLALLVAWLGVQFFALPFLFEQETMSVGQALRNGAALIGNNLAFAFILAGLLLLILIASTFAFMLSFAFGAVILACAANRAVLNRLETIKHTGENAAQPE
ncbi:MAG TPA: DUF624 domain-containing protein [Bellilinea sp.]|nr:DUF624 domain-containing protein [Bellilinea sp.]